MKEIIEINQTTIDGNLPILVLNKSISDIEKAVVQELEKDEYNSIVTMENFKVMKESSQFLGKVAKQISDFRIAKVKEEATDIKIFEDSLKKFTKMFKEKQDAIKSGLDVFEEQTRQKVFLVCKQYFNEFCDQVQLREEFRNINLDDMTLTKYATASFKISKAGIDEVEKRTNIQLTLQAKVDNRLLNLENECLKAQIEPLAKEHIQGFLYANDEEYQIRLRNLIVSEIERNKAVHKREKEKAERELREQIEAEQKEKLRLENEAKKNEFEPISSGSSELPNNTETPFDENIEDGNVRKFVTVTFEVVVPKSWENKVKGIYEKRFNENIKNVENLEVKVQ